MLFRSVLLTFVLSLLLVSRYNVPELLPPNADDVDRRELVKQTLQMGRAFPWLTPRAVQEPVAGAPRQVDTPVRLAFAVDGISLWLIVLAALLMIPAVLVSWNAIEERPARFYALMLLLEAGMIGVFAAQDIILFYIFFEFTLIPLFFMIGIWGGSDRRWAARKFFIYTLAGSVLTFLGLLFIVLSEQWMSNSPSLTFSIPELTASIQQQIASSPQNAEYWGRVSPWIFAALFSGFAIKVPLFPFHTWLPLAHVEEIGRAHV